MKTSKKVALIVAAALFGCGVVLALAGLSIQGSEDHAVPFAIECEEHAYPVSEIFYSVTVENTMCDVFFHQTIDGTSRVECYAPRGVWHSVTVEDGALTVREADSRRWYERWGIWNERIRMDIYLPPQNYAGLSITTWVGDVTLPQWLTVGFGEVKSDTGDIAVQGTVMPGGLTVVTDTGDVTVSDVDMDVTAMTQTGDVKLHGVHGNKLISVKTDTGDVSMKTCASAACSIYTDTGDVQLSDCYADSLQIGTNTGDAVLRAMGAEKIEIKTTTGDVKGTLLSPKVFDIETSTGDVRVPPDGTDCGTCKITTDTGDIDIQIQ